MRYLTYSELIFINGRLLKDEAIQRGEQKIRDIDLLLASEQRPQASAFGQDAYPDMPQKSAVLLHSLSRNHPFKDGNKRTATVAMLLFLRVNGYAVTWQREEALTRILGVAEGRAEWQTFAEWLPITGRTDDHRADQTPDLERDTAHIDNIIQEQKWLLDELAIR
jgi:death-on-curing protein